MTGTQESGERSIISCSLLPSWLCGRKEFLFTSSGPELLANDSLAGEDVGLESGLKQQLLVESKKECRYKRVASISTTLQPRADEGSIRASLGVVQFDCRQGHECVAGYHSPTGSTQVQSIGVTGFVGIHS
jgi:hypothetical protein